MKRRSFIIRAGAALLAMQSPTARSQSGKTFRVGILDSVSVAQNAANLEAFRKGLRDLGYVEGRNVIIEYRSADGHAERFPELAAELLRLNVDLLVTRGTPAARAAKRATDTIPIVIATMGDPRGIVKSYGRPGANVTGLTTFSTELTAKRVQLLKELVPRLRRIALLHNLANPAVPPEWEETERAARVLGLDVSLLDARNEADLRRALERAVSPNVDALVVGADGLIQSHQDAIIDALARHRVPAVYPARDFVERGGLIAYAVNYPELYYRFATYVDKILRGAIPGDIPVEQPAKFELVINLKTAGSLGLTVPQALLLRADELI
jgi:putative tryptophan/tyrosine transport system substrate-binding protein